MRSLSFILPLLALAAIAATTVEPLPPTTEPKPLPNILSEPPEPSTEPATEPAVPCVWLQRRLISLSDALDKAPDDIRPRPTRWPDSVQNQFITWATEELLGTILEQQLHCIAATATATPDHNWELRPTFDTRDFLSFGTMQSWTLSFPPIMIDDDTLAQWRTYHRGVLIKIKGRIQSVNISRRGNSPTGLPQFQFDITLLKPEITPPLPANNHHHTKALTRADTSTRPAAP